MIRRRLFRIISNIGDMIFSEVSSCKSEILFLKINLFILFIFVLFIQFFLFDLKLSRQET